MKTETGAGSTDWIAAAELEKAWRGTARGPKTKARNEENEWDGSETKAAIAAISDDAP